MATISELLAQGLALRNVSDTAKLDAELLLAFVLGKPRSYLFAWPEREPGVAEVSHYRALLARRLAGEPVAHLIGSREFWSLPLMVDASTLIPRPETERLVELALQCTDRMTVATSRQQVRVLDLGTGTGAIAMALASERRAWKLVGVEQEPAALALAKRNRAALALGNVELVQSNWFAALPRGERFHTIVSNPPYIDADDPHLQEGDVRFEPRSALVAADRGLADIAHIVRAAPAYLEPGGWLLLEHGATQGDAVRSLLTGSGYSSVQTWRDYGDRERVTGGRRGQQTEDHSDDE